MTSYRLVFVTKLTINLHDNLMTYTYIFSYNFTMIKVINNSVYALVLSHSKLESASVYKRHIIKYFYCIKNHLPPAESSSCVVVYLFY